MKVNIKVVTKEEIYPAAYVEEGECSFGAVIIEVEEEVAERWRKTTNDFFAMMNEIEVISHEQRKG